MKDYNREINNFEYSKKSYPIPNEHAWDSLKDRNEVKKFETKEHKSQKFEVDENIFKNLSELLTPNNDDVKQSSPEITGQHEALPAE